MILISFSSERLESAVQQVQPSKWKMLVAHTKHIIGRFVAPAADMEGREIYMVVY